MAYEFTDKEIRKEFRRTEVGKKTNLMLYVFIICTAVAIIITAIAIFKEKEFNTTVVLFSGMVAAFLMGMCYFDGKRDGAIAMFKECKKND